MGPPASPAEGEGSAAQHQKEPAEDQQDGVGTKHRVTNLLSHIRAEIIGREGQPVGPRLELAGQELERHSGSGQTWKFAERRLRIAGRAGAHPAARSQCGEEDPSVADLGQKRRRPAVDRVEDRQLRGYHDPHQVHRFFQFHGGRFGAVQVGRSAADLKAQQANPVHNLEVELIPQ